jgi:hypothetical protein
MRPKTLAEVSDLASHGESFDFCLREFLDEFYRKPSQDALVDEPRLLHEAIPTNGIVYDAYLAATAEALACKYGLDTPSWSYEGSRKLHRPWFALTLASLRAVLLLESPAAFRSRNLFVSENALSRA